MKKQIIFLLIAFFFSGKIEFAKAGIYFGGGTNYVLLADDDWVPELGSQFVLGRQWPTFWSRFGLYAEIIIERNRGALNDKLRELSNLDLISDNDIIVHEYAVIDYGIVRANYGCALGIKAYLPGNRLYVEAGVSLLFERMNYKYQKSQNPFAAPPEKMRGKVDYKAEDYLSEGGNRGKQFNEKHIIGVGFEVLDNRLTARVGYNHWQTEVITNPSYDASSRCRGVSIDVLFSF